MRKTLLLLALAIFAVQICAAQDEESNLWNHEGALGLNMAQSYFENWSAGGTDNVTFVGLAKYNINFKKGNSKWDNALDLGLGYNYFDLDKKPVKTDDKIDLSSLYGYNLSNDKFFATAEFTFKTQFVDGFDYTKDSTNRISGFFIPAYFTLGIGAQWVPNKYFSLNVAPVDCRLTIVNDETLADAGSYGVEKAEYDEEGNLKSHGKKTRWELGAQVTAKFEYEIFKNVTFNSKLVAYYDYLRTNEYNAFGEDFQCRIDWDWDNAIVMKVNDWLNCNISARLLYDEDILPIKAVFHEENGGYWTDKGFFQFKEVLSVGFSCKLP